MPSVDFGDSIGRLFLAAVLGAALGFERELRGKAAGLRTNTLIALGSALLTIVSQEMVTSGGDPSRIAAQIVTGIGFLGGGAIVLAGKEVQGLTTAATIWMDAAVGMAVGSGQYRLGLVAAATTLVVLIALVPLEQFLDRRQARTPPVDRTGAAGPPIERKKSG
jgi:putative Mg2+ transporter-C (MgtC) family protein